MDFLNKSITQVSDLFRSMTPGARLTAALLLGVVVVSIAYLFHQGTPGPEAYLFGGEPLSQSQLDAVEAAIAKAKLSGARREGNRIRVPAGQQAAYLAAVADAGALPPNFNKILENALDKGGPWESAAAVRERLKIAKQQTLSEIVRAMDWVDDAVVLYDEQDTRSGRGVGAVRQTTASVSVKPIPGESLDPIRVKNLQKLIAAAISMKPNDVNITNLGDGSASSALSGVSYEIFDDEFLKTKVAFEMQKKESILSALRYIPGVLVEVNAELDRTFEEVTRDVKPDKTSTTANREVEMKQKTTQSTSRGGGQPGPVVQGPNRQLSGEPQQQNTSTTENSTDERTFSVGVTENRILKRGYTPREVWATVTIPSSYIESVWKRRNPTATEPPKPEDLQRVQSEVVANVQDIVNPLLLLGANKGQDTYKWVKVVVLDSLPTPAIEPPSMTSTAIAWTGRHWSTLAMLGVAVFSLLILRNVVKVAPNDAGSGTVVSGPTLSLHVDETADKMDEHERPDERPRLRLKKGKSLKDDLVEIVREDPDTAANILRSWIAKAG